MIRHILIVAWRNICKYKVSAGIAVVGLAMGLLCFVLCNFCARLFFSIDKVFPNYDRMAEIQIKVGEGEELQDYFAGTPPTLAGDMETAFPGQIECCTAVSYGGQNECNLRTRREKTFGLYALYDRGRQQFPEGFLGATNRRKLEAVVPAKECCSIEPVCCTSDFWKTKSGR